MVSLSAHPSLLSTTDVLKQLHVDESIGLSHTTATKRQAQVGLNTLPKPPGTPLVMLYLKQFVSPLIFILFASALLTFFLGEEKDAAVVLAVVMLNSILGFWQEFRAARKVHSLEKFVAPTAKVWRDGQLTEVPAVELTLGDIVLLEAGDRVPADGRLISSVQLACNEASFTGETVPSVKNVAVLRQQRQLSEQKNMVWMGAIVTSGSGRMVVTSLGKQTELGRIAAVLHHTQSPPAHLAQVVGKLGGQLIIGLLVALLLIFIVGTARQYTFFELVRLCTSLAVSAIPEGLPVIVTLTLSLGVWRMAKQRSIVRNLNAVETLGSIEIICTDKTGTLTQGELMVEKVILPNWTATVTGTGFAPNGGVTFPGDTGSPAQRRELAWVARLAQLSTHARAQARANNTYEPIGDPTEVALAVFAEKISKLPDPQREAPAKHRAAQAKNRWQLIYELPFDQQKRYSLRVYLTEENEYLTLMVGAPEVIAQHTQHSQKHTPTSWLLANTTAFAAQGYRMLAIAAAHSTTNPAVVISRGDMPSLTAVSCLALADQLRPEAAEAVQQCQQSGIRVIMITGDHIRTAKHIAKNLGLWHPHNPSQAATGEEISQLSDAELLRILPQLTVIARAAPEIKLRLVKLIQAQQQVVAMTGDGVNDAPALKQADVGIAMGKTGADVTISSADVVLSTDDFASIVHAIKEGRLIWKNLRKVLFYLFSSSLGEVFVILGSLILSLPLPLLPAQILWLNLVTDGFLDTALATEKADENLLKHPPRAQHASLLDASVWSRLVFTGLWMAVSSILFFRTVAPNDLTKAHTLVLVNLAMLQWFNAWNARAERKFVWQLPILGNRALVVGLGCCVLLQVAAVELPALQQLLGTVSLSWKEWGVTFVSASSILVADTLWKALLRKVSVKKR